MVMVFRTHLIEGYPMQLSRAMSLISASLAIGLAGCSNDGGFFPGTLSHNEGAVDYRVVPIVEPPRRSIAASKESRVRVEGS